MLTNLPGNLNYKLCIRNNIEQFVPALKKQYSLSTTDIAAHYNEGQCLTNANLFTFSNKQSTLLVFGLTATCDRPNTDPMNLSHNDNYATGTVRQLTARSITAWDIA